MNQAFTITFEAMCRLLQDCSGVVVADHVITYPELYEPDDDNDVFLKFSWTSEFMDTEIAFRRKNNETVRLVGSSLFLTNLSGCEEQVTLLVPWHPLLNFGEIVNLPSGPAWRPQETWIGGEGGDA